MAARNKVSKAAVIPPPVPARGMKAPAPLARRENRALKPAVAPAAFPT
jgi:hypothetical protein